MTKIFIIVIITVGFVGESFCQDSLLSKNSWSLTAGINTLYPRIKQYDINNDYSPPYSPFPTFLYNFYGKVYPKIGMGFFTKLSFEKKIINHNHNYLFLNAGMGYKYSSVSLKYWGNERYYDSTLISGNGEVSWKEYYLMPVLGINLLSTISKKIYVENIITINYTFLMSGKETINFTGTKSKNWDVEPFEKKEIILYSQKKIASDAGIIATVFDVYYGIGIGYLVNKNMIVCPQVILPFSNLVSIKKHPNLSTTNLASLSGNNNPLYTKEIYHEITFSIKLNLSLK